MSFIGRGLKSIEDHPPQNNSSIPPADNMDVLYVGRIDENITLEELEFDVINSATTKQFNEDVQDITFIRNENNNETDESSFEIPSLEDETSGNMPNEEEEELPFPTPYEFAMYFIDEIPEMGDVRNVNRHFAAQFTQVV